MADVQDIVFRSDGITVFLNNNTIVNGKYKTINGQIQLIGVSSELRSKCQAFYLNRDISADADIRYFSLGSASAAGAINITENEFTPIALQTVFPLTAIYLPGGFVLATVNGLEVDRGVSYTIAGSTLTWLNSPYTLGVSDKVIIKYENP